jgi:hypothetical protein
MESSGLLRGEEFMNARTLMIVEIILCLLMLYGLFALWGWVGVALALPLEVIGALLVAASNRRAEDNRISLGLREKSND